MCIKVAPKEWYDPEEYDSAHRNARYSLDNHTLERLHWSEAIVTHSYHSR